MTRVEDHIIRTIIYNLTYFSIIRNTENTLVVKSTSYSELNICLKFKPIQWAHLQKMFTAELTN